MTNTTQSLSEQIEQLVRAHIEASRRAATAAIERAFASDTTQARSQPTHAKTRTPGRRRASTEMAELGERFYAAVCAQPGETMGVLGSALGKAPRELHRPMMVLKQAGRLRSVGQRHHTRYYPTIVRTA